jgi:hypothetical protein
MTDPQLDEVDARLKAARQRWRASKPAGLTEDIESVPASAAAAVQAVGLGVVIVGSAHRTMRNSPAGGLATLVVGNGDMVRAIGQVFRSEHGIQLCTNISFALTGGEQIPSLPKIDCGRFHIVDLAGVEVGDGGVVITGTNASPRNGEIQVIGRLNDDTITVESLAGAPPIALPSGVTPCPAPAGGWQPVNGMSGIRNTDPAHAYVSAHADQFGAFWISRPRGGPDYPNAEGTRGPLEIMTVGTVNDPDQIRGELTALFQGPLCIYRVSNSYTDMSAALATARAALGTQLLTNTRDEINNTELLKPRYLTPATASALTGLGNRVTVQPFIVPA